MNGNPCVFQRLGPDCICFYLLGIVDQSLESGTGSLTCLKTNPDTGNEFEPPAVPKMSANLDIYPVTRASWHLSSI